jgi:hypothetical protein
MTREDSQCFRRHIPAAQASSDLKYTTTTKEEKIAESVRDGDHYDGTELGCVARNFYSYLLKVQFRKVAGKGFFGS